MCSKPSKSRMSLKQTKQIIGAAALSSRCGAQIEAAHCLPGIFVTNPAAHCIIGARLSST